MKTVILRSPRYPSDPFLKRAEDSAANAAASEQTSAELAKAAQQSAADSEQSHQLADGARVKAEAAQGKAETAQEGAVTAQGKAETAQGAAEFAQGKAEGAQQAAESAQSKAETAQGGAETAQGKAKASEQAAAGSAALATDEANRSTEQADRAASEATKAAGYSSVVAAEGDAQVERLQAKGDEQATRATVEANRAMNEANRSGGYSAEASGHANRAEAAADRADLISGIENVQEALRLAVVPIPDFHLPLTSNLNIREGVGEITFSRASNADYTNKSGVPDTSGTNEPRITQDGLLIEKTSTNLCIHSNLNNGWGKHWDRYDLVNNEPDPVGGTDAVRLDYRGDNGETGLTKTWVRSMIGAGDFTVSVWAKASEPLPMYIRALVDGKTRNSAPITVGTQWQRVSATFTNTIADTNNSPIWFNVNSNSTFSGKKLWLYFAQCEEGAFFTSPIPTEGTSVTRAEDNNIEFPTLKNIPSFWNSGITIYADTFLCATGQYDRIFQVFSLLIDCWANRYRFYIDSQAVDIPVTDFADLNSWQRIKRICRYDPKTQIMDMWVNGHHVSKNGVVATPKKFTDHSYDNAYIGCQGNGSNKLTGNIKDFKIWNYALTDEQIANL